MSGVSSAANAFPGVDPASTVGGAQRAAALFEQISAWLLVVLLAWAPFPLGSDRPWAWSLLTLLVALVWLTWLPTGLMKAEETARAAKRVALPGLVLVLGIAWALVQASRWTPASWHNAIWTILPEGTGRSASGAVSMNPFATVTEAMKLATYVAAGWLAYVLSRTHAIARRLFVALIVIGTLYAVYGMYLSAIGSGQSMVVEGFLPAYGRDVTGSFTSKNSFATFDGMIFAASLLLVADMATGSIILSRGPRQFLLSLLQFLFGRGAFAVIASALLFVALVLSDSRGGLLATLGGALVLFVFGLLLAARRGAARWAIAGSLVTLIGMAVLFAMSGDTVAGRFNHLVETRDTEARPVMWDATVRAISDNPFLGAGLGTFQDAYQLYADRFEAYVINSAHEDYLELALGLGIPMAALWVTALAALTYLCARGALRRRRRRIFAIAAVAAATIVGLHSLVDFSLQTPAVSLLFAVLLGIGLGQSEGRRSSAT